jgi:hypothetical protein
MQNKENLNKQILIKNEVADLMHEIDRFSQIYYHTPALNGEFSSSKNTYWMGIRSLKYPLELCWYNLSFIKNLRGNIFSSYIAIHASFTNNSFLTLPLRS